MDGSHFDRLVATWGTSPTRRGVAAFLAASGLLPFMGLRGGDAKKKKKKKTTICRNGQTVQIPKKQLASALAQGATRGACPTCVPVRQPCTNNCCASLICEDVEGCDPSGPYCCASSGGACQSPCDCCGTLQCSARLGGTCRDCKILQESCGADDDCCAAVSTCGDNGCVLGAVCHLQEGAACARSCDCGGELFCSERAGHTCHACALPQESCTASGDCCLAASMCGTNGCVPDSDTICCQGIGAFCTESCDCCAGAICDEELEKCVALDAQRATRTSTRALQQRQARDQLTRKSRWSQS